MCFYIYITANLGSWPILLDPRKLLTLDAYAVLLLSCPHAHTPSIKFNYLFSVYFESSLTCIGFKTVHWMMPSPFDNMRKQLKPSIELR